MITDKTALKYAKKLKEYVDFKISSSVYFDKKTRNKYKNILSHNNKKNSLLDSLITDLEE